VSIERWALVCGYCGGPVVQDESDAEFAVHATSGDRVRRSGPGDYVSERHNRAGSAVLAVDVIDIEEWEADAK
jgi:hypothetical protein